MLTFKLSFDRKFYWGFGALASLHHYTESSQHIPRAVTKLDRVLKYVSDAEVAGRGFVATGSDMLLAPYNAAAVSITRGLDQLTKLLRQNPAQSERLSKLRRLVVQ